MSKAKLTVSPAFTVGETDRRLFGSFVEHLGRCVYGGIYEPTHPTADEFGFRGDVMAAVREMNVPIIRYPGGNFVSGYHWEDGIGPKESRPLRADLAWRTTDPNQCGTDDFAAYCKRLGSEPLMTVNLGTAGINEARNLVEYCNVPCGTSYSDKRVANGYPTPHAIKTWCLGNEMDGDWQMGHKSAEEYGRLAAETAKAMKMVDPTIETVVCGSTNPDMPTYLSWDETVLELTYPYVDYISLHRYYGEKEPDVKSLVAAPVEAERYIEDIVHVCDFVKAKKKSNKTMMLSFDEWNVWRHLCDFPHEDWQIAPPLLEETYSMKDALVVGGFFITLLRHCDRVKIACQAQLVNVIAPIMTENGGRILKQATFYPFADVSNLGRGTVYDIRIDTPTYECRYGVVRTVDAAVVKNDKGQTVIFAVNRSETEALPLTCDLSGFGVTSATHSVLTAAPDEYNTMDDQARVIPREAIAPAVKDGTLSCTLPPFSWNVIVGEGRG